MAWLHFSLEHANGRLSFKGRLFCDVQCRAGRVAFYIRKDGKVVLESPVYLGVCETLEEAADILATLPLSPSCYERAVAALGSQGYYGL